MEIHVWYHCHQCQAQPIEGIRWHCETCPDGPENDLCDGCYRQFQAGRVEHPPRTSPGFGIRSEHRFEPLTGQPAEGFRAWAQVPDAAVLVAGACAEPHVADACAEPHVADACVVRPEFRAGLSSAFGGHAFAVRFEGQTLVLTALHVLDELIKKQGIDTTAANSSYSGRELPAVLTKVVLYDLFAANWMLAELGSLEGPGQGGPMLVLPDARTGEEEPNSNLDLAAFDASGAAFLRPASLAVEVPAVGEPVWLAAAVPGKTSGGGARTLAATVVEHTERTLIFRYFARDLSGPLYTSGAPLLNAKGEVVGVNVGGGRWDGARVGHANHVASVRRHLGGQA